MKTVIVDDHPLVRQGLCSILALDNGLEPTGEAANVADAVRLIVQTHPELAIVDLKLGTESGLDVIKQVREKGVACRFLILTSSANPIDFKQAELLGVAGYVLKEALPEELLHAIRLVAKGRKYYDPVIMDTVADDLWENPVEELTSREREVLAALSEGLKNGEIAKKLFITEYTVKKHVSQILDKLGLSDRTQAALYAYEKRFACNGIPDPYVKKVGRGS